MEAARSDNGKNMPPNNDNLNRIDISHPIMVGTTRFGMVELGLSTEDFLATLAAAKKWMLVVSGAEIILVAIFGYMLGTILTAQLSSLQAGARRVADGELGHQILVTGRDELAKTAMSFNKMSDSLVTLARKLESARAQAEEGREVAETILQDAVTSLSEGLLIILSTGTVLQMNTVFKKLHGISTSTRLPENITDVEKILVHDILLCVKGVATIEQLLEPDVIPADNMGTWLSSAKNGDQWTIRYRSGATILYSASKMGNAGMVIIASDFSIIYQAELNARRLERELLQSQKLEAIGTLSGGIAHELNTPIQFVGDNLAFISTASDELLNIVDQHGKLLNAIKQGFETSQIVDEARLTLEATDIDFMKDEIPLALRQSKDGVLQMAQIVSAMKEFTHPTQNEKKFVNLNDVLERAVLVGRSAWKYVAEVDWNLQIPSPIALINESECNQVFLNILMNAADAIISAGREQGRIGISSRSIEDRILITISDNGCGIPKEIQHRVFDQFFTTKDVGKGTGQGLALCHEYIVNRNGGRLYYNSKEGIGTTFHIEFPISVNAQPSV